MKLVFTILSVSLISVILVSSDTKKQTLWLIGDSTMSVKHPTAYPETGWGMPFLHFWDSAIIIDNRAKNGRSSKSFLREKLWEPVVTNLKHGDYVFIQFGHNDESIDKGDRYSTPKEFKENLAVYINQSRDKNAIPVLITPVARRKFDNAGNIIDTHLEYANLVKSVAIEQKVILIDLNEKSLAHLQSLGHDASKLLFNHLEPGQHPNYPKGKTDDTHFNELGARQIASLVTKEIRLLIPELATKLKSPLSTKPE